MLERFDISRLGDADYLAIQFMKQMNVDPVALALLLRSTGNIAPALLDSASMPTLVVTGSEDREVGSPELLAERLSDARFQSVPGNHMSCVTKRELGTAIATYLAT